VILLNFWGVCAVTSTTVRSSLVNLIFHASEIVLNEQLDGSLKWEIQDAIVSAPAFYKQCPVTESKAASRGFLPSIPNF